METEENTSGSIPGSVLQIPDRPERPPSSKSQEQEGDNVCDASDTNNLTTKENEDWKNLANRLRIKKASKALAENTLPAERKLVPPPAESPQLNKSTVSMYSEAREEKSRGSKVYAIFKELLSYIISFVLAMTYMAVGGILFVSLELENEKNECNVLSANYFEKYHVALESAVNVATKGNNETLLRKELNNIINTWSKDIFTLNFNPSTNCTTLGTADNLANWNLLNSMFFCLTIMTTIGYGHISPSTIWGQIVCIIYTVIGIPIMVIFLAKIGDLMASVFRYIYLNVCCCKCFIKHYKEKDVDDDPRVPCMGQKDPEQHDFQNTPPEKVNGPIIIEDDELEEIDYSEMEINVPISVSLLILTVYNLMGAALFMIWEDWTLIQGTYFSFISLTTVGFGDLYPTVDTGMGRKDALDELMVGIIYMLLGLALLSMCLQLIQDEFLAKFVWLSEKFGCGKKEEPEEDIIDDDEQIEDFPPPITARPDTTHTNKAFNQTEC